METPEQQLNKIKEELLAKMTGLRLASFTDATQYPELVTIDQAAVGYNECLLEVREIIKNFKLKNTGGTGNDAVTYF